MTREEAIEFIGQSVKNDVDMAKVADAIIAIEQKPCEDAVSRMAINNLRKYNLVGGIVTVSLKDINKLPPANPQEPKTGHWIEEEDFDGETCYRCSKCNEVFVLYDGTPTDYLYNYCPNCGAKMAESEEKK